MACSLAPAYREELGGILVKCGRPAWSTIPPPWDCCRELNVSFTLSLNYECTNLRPTGERAVEFLWKGWLGNAWNEDIIQGQYQNLRITKWFRLERVLWIILF